MEDNPAENYDEVSFYTAGPNVVVVLRHPVRLYFWGKFKAQLLYGNVCILGCILQNSQPYEVYSPRGLGKLYFETLPTEDAFNPMVLFPILANTSLNAFNTEQIATSISEHDVVLYLQSNNNTLTSYFKFFKRKSKPFPTSSRASENSEHHYNASLQTFFYKMDECTLGVNIGENWYDLSNHIFSNDGNAKILVCGGKNVGKSTFNRFLLNTQVLQTPVIYVDLDIGQPEFGFPGTISASMIDEPVFGPSYTHTHTSFLHMKFIRDIDVMKNTGLYLNSVKDMVNDLWKEYADYPWIINTMGFVKGFGDSINISCIKLTRPTSVVQIHDKDAKNNYDCYMRPETVHQYQTHNLGVYIPDEQLNFNHMLIMSEAQSGKRNADGKQMRDLKVISYFSNILSDDKFHLTQYKPLEASLSKLKIWSIDTLAPNLIASSLNTNIVALCNVRNELKTKTECGLNLLPHNLKTGLNCLGFGIVRGVAKDKIYLLTPLSLEELDNINCIANCTQALPLNMLTKVGPEIKGHAPFVNLKRDRPITANIPKRNYYLQRSFTNRSAKET
ncbi:LOW QUALITY PROTEIN: polynucleotide 5'-hydroxyl-kinase NOL9 [Ctenocephalides felis]|uniref:LOW QUALITY PROTEIN: polynucleotide 5'-hydroxyl-kinase NOL9 n=1 Tax=Ctenocephalides felis TaxID=7515 RepID=UPI000E6E5BA8|nr:LOW QUALITY PROTEIN: polynucleotide 5'-hydroxyl-kinase NOL9 [Ctenocephalides felis]